MRTVPIPKIDAASAVSPTAPMRRDTAAPAATAPPRDSAQGAFDAALRRAAMSGRSDHLDEGPHHDGPERDAPPTPLSPTLQPMSMAAVATAAPPRAGAVPAMDALSLHLTRLGSAGESAVPARWQLQLLDRSLPVQHLDVLRSAAGGLQLTLGADADLSRRAPLDRLRDRLRDRQVDRGGPTVSVHYGRRGSPGDTEDGER